MVHLRGRIYLSPMAPTPTKFVTMTGLPFEPIADDDLPQYLGISRWDGASNINGSIWWSIKQELAKPNNAWAQMVTDDQALNKKSGSNDAMVKYSDLDDGFECWFSGTYIAKT